MKKLSDRYVATLAVIFAVLFGGAVSVFIKIGLRQTSPEVFTFLRFFLASAVLLPLLGRSRIKLDKDLLKLIGISLLSTANILLFAYGLRLTTASIGQSIYVFGPMIVTVISYFLLKERISKSKLLGMLIGFTGAVIIILLPVFEKSSPFSGNLLGNLLILLGSISFSFYSVLSKKLHLKFSPMQITLVFCLTTTLAMLILILPQISALGHQIGNFSKQTLFSVFYVGVPGTAISYILFQYAVKHGSPLIASTMLYLQPITTILAASIILGERLTTGFVFGALLASLGTYLIIKARQ